jgi:hypothetical protein
MTKEKVAHRGLAAVERREAKPFPRFWRRYAPFSRHSLP